MKFEPLAAATVALEGSRVSTSDSEKQVIRLDSRVGAAKTLSNERGMIRGEARWLGTLVRSGKIVDYYRIDDGETVSYVYRDREPEVNK